MDGSLRPKAEAADARAHFLLWRSRHGRAVLPLELVTSTGTFAVLDELGLSPPAESGLGRLIRDAADPRSSG
jgi:hypothetical protein